MQSRGFLGETYTMDQLVWRWADSLWLAAFITIAAAATWVGR
jgi:hypothetical protein